MVIYLPSYRIKGRGGEARLLKPTQVKQDDPLVLRFTWEIAFSIDDANCAAPLSTSMSRELDESMANSAEWLRPQATSRLASAFGIVVAQRSRRSLR
jgi:hypothetical protein